MCTFVNLSAGVPCYLFSNACTQTACDYISEALYAAMFTSVCVHRRVSAWERWTTADKRVCISHSTLMQRGGNECSETTLYSCWDRTMATCWASTSIVSEYNHISLFFPRAPWVSWHLWWNSMADPSSYIQITESDAAELTLNWRGLSWHTGKFFIVTFPAKGGIPSHRVEIWPIVS